MANILAYILDKKIYINLTNRCTNDCIFCLRKDKADVKGQELWLDDENFSVDDVISQFEKLYKKTPTNEVIFCGYGEPLIKLELLKSFAKYLKTTYPNIKTRVNTNGHANFVHKRNVIPEINGLIDEISVSLNGSNKEEYNELSQPKFDSAYEEVKKFIKSSVDGGIKTTASIVDGYKGKKLDIESCENIAKSLGATLRVREWIPCGY